MSEQEDWEREIQRRIEQTMHPALPAPPQMPPVFRFPTKDELLAAYADTALFERPNRLWDADLLPQEPAGYDDDGTPIYTTSTVRGWDKALDRDNDGAVVVSSTHVQAQPSYPITMREQSTWANEKPDGAVPVADELLAEALGQLQQRINAIYTNRISMHMMMPSEEMMDGVRRFKYEPPIREPEDDRFIRPMLYDYQSGMPAMYRPSVLAFAPIIDTSIWSSDTTSTPLEDFRAVRELARLKPRSVVSAFLSQSAVIMLRRQFRARQDSRTEQMMRMSTRCGQLADRMNAAHHRLSQYPTKRNQREYDKAYARWDAMWDRINGLYNYQLAVERTVPDWLKEQDMSPISPANDVGDISYG